LVLPGKLLLSVSVLMPLVYGNFSLIVALMNIAVLDSVAKYSGPRLVDRLNQGLEVSTFRKLAAAVGLTIEALASALGLSPRTLRNRAKLTADESERTFRAYRVYLRAVEVMENEDMAYSWMQTKQKALDNRTPLSLLVRDVGAEQVMQLLGAIEDGGYL
jgi:putative toxin-antitoxin system antitoxin component (TIGR02293 family)